MAFFARHMRNAAQMRDAPRSLTRSKKNSDSPQTRQMKETWRFNDDLTDERKIERYESAITTGPFFQSSYSRPNISLERGIWAPPDTTLDELTLFVMSTDGFTRSIKLE